MNGEHISRALNHLPDDMIAEAMAPQKAIPWKRITAVAATLAILLTALLWPRGATSPSAFVESPGILKAYACEADETEKLQQKEYMLLPGVSPSYLAAWSPIVNLLTGGIRLTFITDEEDLCDHEITYDISVNYGELHGSYHLDDGTVDVWGKSHIATNKETIRWLGNELFLVALRECILKTSWQNSNEFIWMLSSKQMITSSAMQSSK